MAKSISPNLPRRRSRPRGQNAPAWMLVQVFAAGKIGRQRFVCGLICGAFYALCLLAAAFLVHGVPSWTGSDVMLPLALLLGGTLGGALSAIKEGH